MFVVLCPVTIVTICRSMLIYVYSFRIVSVLRGEHECVKRVHVLRFKGIRVDFCESANSQDLLSITFLQGSA